MSLSDLGAFQRSGSTWADDVEAEEAEAEKEGIPLQTQPEHAPLHAEPIPEPAVFGEVYHADAEVPGFPLPENPPWKVYISNVPYELDDFEVERFFSELKIVDLHISRHRDTGKAKACFVEFAERDMMLAALDMGLQGDKLLGRRVDIQPAQPKGERRGGFGGRDTFADRGPPSRGGGGFQGGFPGDGFGGRGRRPDGMYGAPGGRGGYFPPSDAAGGFGGGFGRDGRGGGEMGGFYGGGGRGGYSEARPGGGFWGGAPDDGPRRSGSGRYEERGG